MKHLTLLLLLLWFWHAHAQTTNTFNAGAFTNSNGTFGVDSSGRLNAATASLSGIVAFGSAVSGLGWSAATAPLVITNVGGTSAGVVWCATNQAGDWILRTWVYYTNAPPTEGGTKIITFTNLPLLGVSGFAVMVDWQPYWSPTGGTYDNGMRHSVAEPFSNTNAFGLLLNNSDVTPTQGVFYTNDFTVHVY